ncbi:HD domain-containing protein [Mesobacillus harenae]|uniref:HD domain-containing protein n=1 Tax=Mesobacillus harenae TaxID=2213203 RepID=UPI0015805889|nr:HD domain-containing protein [Mesobacillus harenae]
MKDILLKAEQLVKQELGGESSGHDWHHIDRVRKNALLISESEPGADKFILELAALLHDIPDDKLNSSEEAGREKLAGFFSVLELPLPTALFVTEIIDSVSFKGGHGLELSSLEAKIVQDADRLDAIGAIGITRVFAFGGKKGQAIYDPELPVREKMTTEEYRNGKSSSIHHFYEKLLKLKDQMNTDTAKLLAEERHAFMEHFLNQFYKEWDGRQ